MEALAAAMALLQTNPTMFASLAGATVKPAKTRVVKEGVEKKERVVKEIALEDRCRAIAYDGATGHPVQCSKSKKDGCRFCSLHQKKAEESEEACQYFEDGRKKGLFFGYIPDGEELDASKVPFMSADGMICTVYRGPEEFVERLAEAKKEGAKYHPFSNEGGGKKARQALRPADAPVRVRKPKAETEPKEPKEKAVRGRKAKDPNAPKRGQNAYFLFAGSVRPEITEEVKVDAEWADKPHSQRFGEIGRRVKARWDALSDEEKAPFLEQEAAEKARYAEEKASYVPSTETVATEPKKRGRPAGKKAEKEQLDAVDQALAAALLATVGMPGEKRIAELCRARHKVVGSEETAHDVLLAERQEAEAEAGEDEEEAGEDEEEDAKSVAFDPETAVAEEEPKEDAEDADEPYFTAEIDGKDVMVMKEDQGDLKAGCVYELTTDEEGDTVPGKQIGTWKNDAFVPLPAKKPTIVVGGKKA